MENIKVKKIIAWFKHAGISKIRGALFPVLVLVLFSCNKETDTIVEPDKLPDQVMISQSKGVIKVGYSDGQVLHFKILNDSCEVELCRNLVGAPYTGDVYIPSSVICDGKTYQVVGLQLEVLKDCMQLNSVCIPNIAIPNCDYMFSDCRSLTKVSLPNNLTSIGYCMFSRCESLVSVVIPDSVASVGYYAFLGCENLISIKFSNRVKSIGGEVFRDCFKLQSVILPDSLDQISNGLFYNCKALVTITIPDNVKGIGSEAFSGCDQLTEMHVRPLTPPTLWHEPFSSEVKIYVPQSALAEYQNSSTWSKYTLIGE